MNIKTITTIDGVNEVDFGSSASRFYWFRNVGTTAVHVSGNADIVAGSDGVAELAVGDSVCIETLSGKVYVLGAGKVQIHNTGDKFCPFKNAPAAGGGGGNSYTKSESDAKYAQKTDIPSSLPANGGNADISKYIGTWGSPEQYYGEQLKVRVLFNKFGDNRFGLTTDTDNEIRVDHATNADTVGGKTIDSLTPIKSTTCSGTTDANGNLMLWAASENKIPICAILTGYCSSIFHYAPDGNYYLGVSDIATQAYSPNVSVSGTVYYIEQG